MKARLIDIGSTNIKSALFDTDNNLFTEEKFIPFPAANEKKIPFYELNMEKVESCIRALLGKGHDVIFICTQMHGYVLIKKNGSVSNYISWKDKRAGLAYVPASLPVEYGVNMKVNLPRASVEYMRKYMPEALTDVNTFCTLGSYIAYRLCKQNASHITDLAASGFYHIKSGIADRYFLSMPKAFLKVDKIGMCDDFDVYSPCGDQQTAVFGSFAEDSIVLNIGTASQMCCVGNEILNGDFENRPYFYGKILYTVTGLPGGELLEKNSDAKMYDIFRLAWRAALEKLPPRNMITVTGGAVYYKKYLIKRVLDELGMKYTFSSGNETMRGLARMAKEFIK